MNDSEVFDEVSREETVAIAAEYLTIDFGSDEWITSSLIEFPLHLENADACVLYRVYGVWGIASDRLVALADDLQLHYDTDSEIVERAFCDNRLNLPWTDFIEKALAEKGRLA